jgi:tRNA dimethylallyltransferase
VIAAIEKQNMGLTANRPPRHAIVTVLGPTGSGKSALALDVAEGFRGEIVNCDSLQLYRGFDIGTAKTPPNERRGVPHHLFDVLEPQMGYSAGEYSRQARTVIAQITARGRLPVIVGGTGFYLRALLAGLPALPERDEDLRSRLLAKEQARPGRLHRLLTRLEPAAAARIHPRDVQKATRALEVRLLTGTSMPAPAQAQALEGYVNVKIGLNPDRAVLHKRLDTRVEAMFNGGLLDEVRTLLAQGTMGTEKAFEALGYKQALLHLRGKLTLEEAIASTQLETRQYAKRQWTWFRRDPEIFWIAGLGDSPAVVAAARGHLAERLADFSDLLH